VPASLLTHSSYRLPLAAGANPFPRARIPTRALRSMTVILSHAHASPELTRTASYGGCPSHCGRLTACSFPRDLPLACG